MSPRGNGSDEEGFLTRWARRKAAIARENARPARPLSPHPEEPRGGVSTDVSGGSGANWSIIRGAARDGMAPQDESLERPDEDVGGPGQEPEMVEPPSLDLVDKDFDVAHWLKQNVPESWKLAALRRAWESDPAIRDFENPARDYALDWNTPGGAPGYGPLTESDDVEAMVRGIFGETPPAASEPPLVAEATSDSMSHRLSSYDPEAPDGGAVQETGPSEPPPRSGESDQPGDEPGSAGQIAQSSADHADIAVRHNAQPETAPRRVRRRGGGAVPN
jgi:hypothetical protein